MISPDKEMRVIFLLPVLLLLIILPVYAQSYDTDDDGIPDVIDKCDDEKEDYLGINRFDGCSNNHVVDQIDTQAESDGMEELNAGSVTSIDSLPNVSSEISQIEIHDMDAMEASEISYDSLINYLNKIVNDVTDKASFNDIIIFSLGVTVYGIFVFHFYQFIARRDVFSFDLERRLGGGKYRSTGERKSAAPRVAAYITTKFVIFPIIVFAWFLAYSMFILLLTQDMTPDKVFFVASILIIGIRITSYYNEDLSKDLAKIIPFAILGIFLFDQTFFTVQDVTNNINQIPKFITQIAAFLIVAFVVEIILSVAYLIKVRFSGKKKKNSSKTESEQAI
jgi:large-conductance mechanosensitive channel